MKKEVATSLLVIVFCGAFLRQAMALPKPRFEPLGPAFFPVLILGVIIGLSVLHIVITLWRGRARAISPPSPETRRRSQFDESLPWISALAFAAYILLISYSDIPYLLLTFCFVVGLAWTMASFRKSAILPILVVAAGLLAVIQFVFVAGLNILLP